MSTTSGRFTTRFGGLVISSADPERLANWYRRAFAPDSAREDFIGRPVVVVGGATLVFDSRDDVAAVPVEAGRVLIDLYVDNMQAAEAHLDTLDANWTRPVESVPGLGSIATLTDADGNYVQLLHSSSR